MISLSPQVAWLRLRPSSGDSEWNKTWNLKRSKKKFAVDSTSIVIMVTTSGRMKT